VGTRATPYLRALWIGALLFVTGIVLDLRWHLEHDEFEGVSQQFEAHWLLWLGVLATLVVAYVGVRRVDIPSLERRGYAFVLGSGLAYTAVAVWHFIEHANHQDPEVAHVLLGVAQVAMLIGAVVASRGARSQQRPITA
jgi:hypothetical protein